MKKLVGTKKDKVFNGAAMGIAAGLVEVIRGLGDIVATPERSDSLQQRLSTINSEIERQLKQAPAGEKGMSG